MQARNARSPFAGAHASRHSNYEMCRFRQWLAKNDATRGGRHVGARTWLHTCIGAHTCERVRMTLTIRPMTTCVRRAVWIHHYVSVTTPASRPASCSCAHVCTCSALHDATCSVPMRREPQHHRDMHMHVPRIRMENTRIRRARGCRSRFLRIFREILFEINTRNAIL